MVTAFIPSLAHCRAGRLIGAEVEKRYQGDVQQARTAAKAQAKLDRDKAMTDAEAAVPPSSGPSDERRYRQEVQKARAAAETQTKRDARTHETQAAAAVRRQDPTVVQS